MMGVIWVVLFSALHLAHGLPLRPTPQAYPHEASNPALEGWGTEGVYAALPALALVVTAVGLLFGCTWCYRHKDCKPNEGADNQIFTASATHLHDGRRSQPPDSGFSEPANNNISEDNNNGPISLREMQNIANNNAAAYIVSENEERNRMSRESVVEFEPLPIPVRVADPLERCADWFAGDDLPRNRLQYLREIGRGWFGRVVEGEIDDGPTTRTVAVKILNQNASLEEKARFLDEARVYRDVSHESVLAFVAKCLQEDPWILIFELCAMDLQQYLMENRPKMAILNESGVPLQLMCDVTSALSHLHSRGYLYGEVWSGNVLVRSAEAPRALLGHYCAAPRSHCRPPEASANPPLHTTATEVWCAGVVLWEVCAWGSPPPAADVPPPLPQLPCPYRNHLYQVMQLCWHPSPEERPSAAQVHALVQHLHLTHARAEPHDDGYGSSDFEDRWQRLKPNSIPKLDEHVAIVHAPSASLALPALPAAGSRSSSIASDGDPLSAPLKSESLTNLHGSLEDVRNIYLTHDELANLECHQGNVSLEEAEREHDRSDTSVDPWLKDIIAGSQDDVSYYRDVSDVIKNLDNILNSEKTSSSESSHQASPSRDNLNLECKRDYPAPKSIVKSPGITNFQNVLEMGFDSKSEETEAEDDDVDRDTLGTLSHSFERHSDTTSQQTLENLTPETPIKDVDVLHDRSQMETMNVENESEGRIDNCENIKSSHGNELPKDKISNSDSEIPKLKELCVASMPSISETITKDVNVIEDCRAPCDIVNELRTDIKEIETKSVDDNDKNCLKTEIDSDEDIKGQNELRETVVRTTILPLSEDERTNSALVKAVSHTKNCVDESLATNYADTQKSEVDVNTKVIVSLNANETATGTSDNNSCIELLLSDQHDESEEQKTENIITDDKVSDMKCSNVSVVSPIIDSNSTQKSVNEDTVNSGVVLSDNDILHTNPIDIGDNNEKNKDEVKHENSCDASLTNVLVASITSDEINLDQLAPHEDARTDVILSQICDAKVFCDDINITEEIRLPVSELNESFFQDNPLDVINSGNTDLPCYTDKKVALVTDGIENKNVVHEPFVKEAHVEEVLTLKHIDLQNRIDSGEDTIALKNQIIENNESKMEFVAVEHLNDPLDINNEKLTDSFDVENEITPEIPLSSDIEEQKIHIVETTTSKVPGVSEEVVSSVHHSLTSDCRIDSLIEVNEKAHVDNFHNSTVHNIENIDSPNNKIETATEMLNQKTSDNFDMLLDSASHEQDLFISPNEDLIVEYDKNSSTDNINTVNHIQEIETIEPAKIPDTVQNLIMNIPLLDTNFEEMEAISENHTVDKLCPDMSPEIVQNNSKTSVTSDSCEINLPTDAANGIEINNIRSDINSDRIEPVDNAQSKDSTAYMDLINDTKSEALKYSLENVPDVMSCLDANTECPSTLIKNESTVYLDLPSMIKETDNFLHSEKAISSQNVEFNDVFCASTPKGSNSTANTLECSVPNETDVSSETGVPDYGAGVTLTKLEQKYVPENLSPFDSPTKSHHTDTYDENSSVVLGPFENCTLELFKGVKSSELDIPKEELLAFSSNFSEMNLETPSPLRDGNFLNEVPDLHFDDVCTSEAKSIEAPEPIENSDATDEQSTTEKRVSPSTPPNSPGNFLASSSQQNYIVDIDLSMPNENMPVSQEVDLSQIELQITAKMAIAENENNMNIEYSGPLTEEGLRDDSLLTHENDAIPESYLAGNGSVEDFREGLALDEERMKELRNELELKLPLAQVASIEPQGSTWSELPPPPDLVLNYGALSPIAEETRQQLSAYENDDQWNASIRTESSESYPEPCNNSTDDVTDLPTAAQSGPHESHTSQASPSQETPNTYTIHSRDNTPNNTYTVHKEVPSSKEMTMSADSLNASPLKRPKDDSPIDDRTYNKNDDEKESCERLSQVSPFLLSPTTDTSIPEQSDPTALSTVSKTTVPTDAKASKPSETQCLSKATSIDSWCSNDTLYNVEENFDDLAMDPEVPVEFERSESEHTLTHNDDDKELSHCSTYIVHDSKSACETFSPDSITANDNYTYTKVKTEATGTTPTKSDVNDSTKNTTKDLAYGTLMSGIPSYSNCTTEVMSGIDDAWKLPQPELVRRSPIPDDMHFSPPQRAKEKDCDESEPLTSEPRIKKMESIEITCLKDDSNETEKSEPDHGQIVEINDSPNFHYRNMAHSVTSTPLTETGVETDVEGIPMHLPESKLENTEFMNNIPNFQVFLQSAEIRPQDISSNANSVSNQDTEILLEGDSKTLSRNSYKDSLGVSERTPTYSDFESSATTKPQDVLKEKSSHSIESGVSSEDFRLFESSVRDRPQDLSSLIDASSLLLKSERRSSELAMGSLIDETQSSRAVEQSLVLSPPNVTNLTESHSLGFNQPINIYVTDLDLEEETEQPHSIIITESPMIPTRVSPNRTFDSHSKIKDLNHTYDSHNGSQPERSVKEVVEKNEVAEPKVNGVSEHTDVSDKVTDVAVEDCKISTPKQDITEILRSPVTEEVSIKDASIDSRDSRKEEVREDSVEIKCNGNSEKYATVQFLNETFEELMESNVDDGDVKDLELGKESVEKSESDVNTEQTEPIVSPTESKMTSLELENVDSSAEKSISNGLEDEGKVSSVTENFLQNEKQFCQFDSYLPLLSDIRFTGPATEIMSTSFTQDSPTEPTSPECEQNSKPDPTADILKEWDSDSESHSSNSSSGEFIWKDGDGHETSVVPTTHFDHQRDGGTQPHNGGSGGADASGDSASGSGSGSGSEGDEVEFVPSSWDCRAAPSKSSLRSLEQPPESKKRVVFKRQKYHCVYEYPREAFDDTDSPAAYLPDFSTYSEWDPSNAEEAELGYGQLFGAPNPLDLFPLRAGIAFGADYDGDFFISSSARPFESLGVMSTTSQFFPGMHVKPMLERELAEDAGDDFPPPPSPLPHNLPHPAPPAAPPSLPHTRTPSLDFTTPDSGVEDITPGSTVDDDFKAKKLPEDGQAWRLDSTSSSESVSPSSPGGEALGGLRHTRDKLKLDLPPSPHIPSPRHSRVFNFVLDKPKRRDERPEPGTTPLVMTDETPVAAMTLPVPDECEDVAPEPTFSTFGKTVPTKTQDDRKAMILTDETEDEPVEETKEGSSVKVETVKGEGTVLDSGDEDSGIESSSKATLERAKPTSNVS